MVGKSNTNANRNTAIVVWLAVGEQVTHSLSVSLPTARLPLSQSLCQYHGQLDSRKVVI